MLGQQLGAAFVNVYLPMQTNLVAASEIHEAKQLASRSMLWIAFIISGITLAFAIVREPVFVLLFTSKYAAAADTAVMFRRLVPNLRAIGLLTPRIMPHYQRAGLAEFVDLPSTDTLSDAAVAAT